MSHILKKALGVVDKGTKNMNGKGFARWFSNWCPILSKHMREASS
jgi:hypothetical protein